MSTPTVASEAARAAAEALGAVEGSSYTTVEGEPVAWAFDIAAGPHRLILAGAADLELRIALLTTAEHAFTVMLYGKALASEPTLELEPGTVVLVRPPPDASWYCDSFYLADPELPGLGELDLVAIAMHASEAGLADEDARTAVVTRTPERLSLPDPRAGEPHLREWSQLVRASRRYRRLRELEAPAELLTNDRDRILTLRRPEVLAFAPLPDDVRDLELESGAN